MFEHHEAMQPHALRAFVYEYRLRFPIGIDAHTTIERSSDNGHAVSPAIPRTMHAYGMRGTPSLILIDRLGIVRYHNFGRPNDLEVGRVVGTLLSESASTSKLERMTTDLDSDKPGCTSQGCSLPA